MKWWAAGNWRVLHCLILLQEQGLAHLPRLTWPPATFSMSIPVKRRHTPMTSPSPYLMEEMRCIHAHTLTLTGFVFYEDSPLTYCFLYCTQFALYPLYLTLTENIQCFYIFQQKSNFFYGEQILSLQCKKKKKSYPFWDIWSPKYREYQDQTHTCRGV